MFSANAIPRIIGICVGLAIFAIGTMITSGIQNIPKVIELLHR